MANKQDANLTGLRFAEESSLGVLPGSPVWYPLEPNSYKDFGGQIKTVARSPINPSRQRKKGVVTDLDSAGGFSQDLTGTNLTRALQGFFFAAIREKKTSVPMNSTAIAFTSVTASTKTVAAASGLDTYIANSIVIASGFTNVGNNGFKTVASKTASTLVLNETMTDEASPPAAAKIVTVGYQFPSADASIAMNGSLVRLTSAAIDFTTLGLIAGEWIFIGGDAANTYFANNKGYARISSIVSTYLEFDKTSFTGQVEAGTGKTIQVFFGSVLKNESDPTLITRRTVQLERTVGSDGVGTMSEYIVGAVPNELTINIPQADKVTVDLSYVAIDHEQRTGTKGVKSGDRPAVVESDAFNTSSDLARVKLATVSDTNPAPTPLFAFATEMKITINNNVSPDKAIGVLGAFDTSAGDFIVGGSATVYFADVTATQAVRDNSDVTLDVIMTKNNAGLLFDIPLLSLGDGRLTVEKDQSIKLPLETNAAESKFGTTLLFQRFDYLPTAAM